VPRRSNRQSVPQKRNSSNKLDWNSYNLLENLLIFCTVRDSCAPPESGVKFRINSPASDDIVCILFKIDRDEDPLIETGPRPDYMVFYADHKVCVCTIIEMKGTAETNLAHGIEQIKEFRDRLRREIRDHLPNKFSSVLKFQAILLSPPNSTLPLPKILQEKNKGFVILPLQYKFKAELFDYVSKVHEPTAVGMRYIHKNVPHDPNRGLLESIMVEKPCNERKQDEFCSANFSAGKSRKGVYVNYALAESDYAVLAANNASATIAIKDSNGVWIENIERALSKLKLSSASPVNVEQIS
jgi:hypothetical protein